MFSRVKSIEIFETQKSTIQKLDNFGKNPLLLYFENVVNIRRDKDLRP
jgi:hypothetical protein